MFSFSRGSIERRASSSWSGRIATGSGCCFVKRRRKYRNSCCDCDRSAQRHSCCRHDNILHSTSTSATAGARWVVILFRKQWGGQQEWIAKRWQHCSKFLVFRVQVRRFAVFFGRRQFCGEFRVTLHHIIDSFVLLIAALSFYIFLREVSTVSWSVSQFPAFWSCRNTAFDWPLCSYF